MSRAPWALTAYLCWGAAAVACAPDPETTSIVPRHPAKIYSYTYLCELGYPGYESYCEDFNSVNTDDCPRSVVDAKDWNAASQCGLVSAGPLQAAVRDALVDWIVTNEQFTADWYLNQQCDQIAQAATGAVSDDRARSAIATITDGVLTYAAVSDYGTSRSWDPSNLLAVVSPYRFTGSNGIANVASDIIHEVTHASAGYIDYFWDDDLQAFVNYGADNYVLDTGWTVGQTLDDIDSQCFRGFRT